MDKNKDKNTQIAFSAINQTIVDNIVKPDEVTIRNTSYVLHGKNNDYSNYIWNLYQDCSTLHALVDSRCDYIKGDDIINHLATLSNKKAQTLVSDLALSLTLFGGAYIEVQRNHLGRPCKFNVLDFRCIRTNEDKSIFYYSKDFLNNKSYGRIKNHVYSAYNPKNTIKESQILFVSNSKYTTYPICPWNSSAIDTEVLREIKNYNLNTISNGFVSPIIITLLNGIPDDEMRTEIEECIQEKFCDSSNTGRIAISFAPDKDHGTNIQEIHTEDLTERFKTLVERSKANLYTSFHTSPILMGIPREGNGFTEQEFSETFKLYAKTVCQPIQTKIVDIIDMLTGIESSIEIQPFSLNFNEDNDREEEAID